MLFYNKKILNIKIFYYKYSLNLIIKRYFGFNKKRFILKKNDKFKKNFNLLFFKYFNFFFIEKNFNLNFIKFKNNLNIFNSFQKFKLFNFKYSNNNLNLFYNKFIFTKLNSNNFNNLSVYNLKTNLVDLIFFIRLVFRIYKLFYFFLFYSKESLKGLYYHSRIFFYRWYLDKENTLGVKISKRNKKRIRLKLFVAFRDRYFRLTNLFSNVIWKNYIPFNIFSTNKNLKNKRNFWNFNINLIEFYCIWKNLLLGLKKFLFYINIFLSYKNLLCKLTFIDLFYFFIFLFNNFDSIFIFIFFFYTNLFNNFLYFLNFFLLRGYLKIFFYFKKNLSHNLENLIYYLFFNISITKNWFNMSKDIFSNTGLINFYWNSLDINNYYKKYKSKVHKYNILMQNIRKPLDLPVKKFRLFRKLYYFRNFFSMKNLLGNWCYSWSIFLKYIGSDFGIISYISNYSFFNMLKSSLYLIYILHNQYRFYYTFDIIKYLFFNLTYLSNDFYIKKFSNIKNFIKRKIYNRDIFYNMDFAIHNNSINYFKKFKIRRPFSVSFAIKTVSLIPWLFRGHRSVLKFICTTAWKSSYSLIDLERYFYIKETFDINQYRPANIRKNVFTTTYRLEKRFSNKFLFHEKIDFNFNFITKELNFFTLDFLPEIFEIRERHLLFDPNKVLDPTVLRKGRLPRKKKRTIVTIFPFFVTKLDYDWRVFFDRHYVNGELFNFRRRGFLFYNTFSGFSSDSKNYNSGFFFEVFTIRRYYDIFTYKKDRFDTKLLYYLNSFLPSVSGNKLPSFHYFDGNQYKNWNLFSSLWYNKSLLYFIIKQKKYNYTFINIQLVDIFSNLDRFIFNKNNFFLLIYNEKKFTQNWYKQFFKFCLYFLDKEKNFLNIYTRDFVILQLFYIFSFIRVCYFYSQSINSLI